jgi:hypothetical protein
MQFDTAFFIFTWSIKMEHRRKLIQELINAVAMTHVFAEGINNDHQLNFFALLTHKFFEITIESLQLESDEINHIIFEAQALGEKHIRDIKNKIQ